jgi:hypothetical protein
MNQVRTFFLAATAPVAIASLLHYELPTGFASAYESL